MAAARSRKGGAPSSSGEHLYSASDVARFCQVDLKTVHNWADKGAIDHFRTPGRHMRIREPALVEFLRNFGYPLPPELRDRKTTLVGIIGSAVDESLMDRVLGKRFEVVLFDDPVAGLLALGRRPRDVLVLDLDVQGVDGLFVLRRMRRDSAGEAIGTPSVPPARWLFALSDRADRRAAALEAGAQAAFRPDELARLRDEIERTLA